MSMMTNTLGRYFAGRFVVSALGVFASIFVLLVLVDYIEMVRKTSGLVSASAVVVQYVMLALAIGAGMWIILGSVVVEPPAALMEAINKSNARLARLFGRPAAA